MNYTQLVTSIQDYAENSFDYSTNPDIINTFIRQAEQRIYNTVQFPSLRKNVTGSTSTGNKYLSCPGDFLAAYSLAVIDASGNYEYLLNKDVNFIRQAYPNPNDQAIPKYYAIFGPTTAPGTPVVLTDELSFILGPTPDAVYGVELHYYFYPESITVAGDGQTWLGDNFDSVEAARFMKQEPDIVAEVDKQYVQSLTLLKNLGDGKDRQDAYRSGQLRTQVV